MFAIIVSLLSHEYVESIVILIILLFNAIFGFVQELKAQKAIESLKELSSLKATVQRDGSKQLVDTKKLVPGDIIFIEEGSKIPADARLIEVNNLMCDESSLTGESVPVSKNTKILNSNLTISKRRNIVFNGSIVTRGTAKAIVTNTGMDTEIGKIADMIENAEDDNLTPLQKKLEIFGKKIGIITLIICAIIFLVGSLREGAVNVLLNDGFKEFIIIEREWFLAAVSLAVAAVPEGLPAIVTIALAIGTKRMLKKKSLIRNLPGVETLGETSVICSDKTGTLTLNKMTVKRLYCNGKDIEITGDGLNLNGVIKVKNNKDKSSVEKILEIGVLCNDSSYSIVNDEVKTTGDPTEIALLISAQKNKINLEELSKKNKRTKAIPFDSIKKTMFTVNKNSTSGKSQINAKGAPEEILNLCSKVYKDGREVKLTQKEKDELLKTNHKYAKKAYRVLAFAYKKFEHQKTKSIEDNLVFVGFQVMIDPPRMEVKDSIKKCHDAHIRVIMITGDNIDTAKEIGKNIGIEGNAITGKEFEKLSLKSQTECIKKTSIFARVEPKHKMIIVKHLQDQNNIVAMTGDGVNDAPAIKQADIGIAMGITGTDVSKQSSDMILMDDNFTTIVSSVEEGRGIYENIKKSINYLFSSNLAEVMIIFFSILFGLPLPMTAIMILWLNLVTDGLPALALSVDKNPSNLMKIPPKKKNESFMDKKTIFNIGFISSLITVAVLSAFIYTLNLNNNVAHAQTVAFTLLILLEFVRIETIRHDYGLKLTDNKYLIYALLGSLVLHLSTIYTPVSLIFGTIPLGIKDWILMILITIIVYFARLISIPLQNLIKN